jgi:O-acetyl-ADP-ribose deacetylase (regulator of RNase III)
MIRVVRGDLAASSQECVLRSTRVDGASITPVGRRLEAIAGTKVSERLAAQGDSPVGTALLTPAGELATSFLIHVVLQSIEEPVTAISVQRGLVNALRRAADFGIDSVALPPLGVGAGNLEAEVSARVMLEVIRNHLSEGAPPSDFEIVVESEYEESVFATVIEASSVDWPGQG